MAPPMDLLKLDAEAISGICGSISIACWVVVFSPQILENFRRGSADGLSIQFIVVWLLGDVFNILGAVMQGVLPTMIILAIYYTIADIVLLLQCFYYRGFTLSDEVTAPAPLPPMLPAENDAAKPDERTALLAGPSCSVYSETSTQIDDFPGSRSVTNADSSAETSPSPKNRRRPSARRLSQKRVLRRAVDKANEAVALDDDKDLEGARVAYSKSCELIQQVLRPDMAREDVKKLEAIHKLYTARISELDMLLPGPHVAPALVDLETSLFTILPTPPSSRSTPLPRHRRQLQAVLFNLFSILLVCAAGVIGWWLSYTYKSKNNNNNSHHHSPPQSSPSPSPPPSPAPPTTEFNPLAQVFGWLCAALYLGSRLPQLLLNWRRKSTEGVSMLFFLFACLGNLTYVLSIVAFDPSSAASPGKDGGGGGDGGAAYWRYLLVNLSWLAGSAGTLFLDFAIFVQFFLYGKADGGEGGMDGDWEKEEDEDEDEEKSVEGDVARKPLLLARVDSEDSFEELGFGRQ